MSLREIFRRNLPQPAHLRTHDIFRLFGHRLYHPELWHLNRRSAAGAASLGLFLAWMPVPVQMLLAAAGALLLRVNLPIAVAAVWLTNPLTMAPLFLFAYEIGATMLGQPTYPVAFEFSLQWFNAKLGQIWLPLTLGCVVMGTLSALVGNLAVRWAWRLHLIQRWRARPRRPRPGRDR